MILYKCWIFHSEKGLFIYLCIKEGELATKATWQKYICVFINIEDMWVYEIFFFFFFIRISSVKSFQSPLPNQPPQFLHFKQIPATDI